MDPCSVSALSAEHSQLGMSWKMRMNWEVGSCDSVMNSHTHEYTHTKKIFMAGLMMSAGILLEALFCYSCINHGSAVPQQFIIRTQRGL